MASDKMDIPSYINLKYVRDLTAFIGTEPKLHGPSGMLCGRTINENLREHKRSSFSDISAFFICQYALNLFNYGIKTHFYFDYKRWLAITPPFADCTSCPDFHGGVKSPGSIINCLIFEVNRQDDLSIEIDDESINTWLAYFFTMIDFHSKNGEFNDLSASKLCEELLDDTYCPEFSFIWPPDDFDLEVNISDFVPWSGVAISYAEIHKENFDPISIPEQKDIKILKSSTNCPGCDGQNTTKSFRVSFDENGDDHDEQDKEMCSGCFQSVFYRTCPMCGANNRSVYFCRNCYASLGSVSDIEPETAFLDSNELASFTEKYFDLFDNIPNFISRTDLDTYVTSEDKREIWHKLPFKEQLEYYRNLDKSYPPSCFNPNSFFGLFDKLRIVDGYFLDYRYYEDDFQGMPAVFARKFGSKSMILAPVEEEEDTAKIFDVISYEPSPVGIFQYALFSGVYDKFYTFAHSNYCKFIPVLTQVQFESLVENKRYNLRDWAFDLLQKQDIRPRITPQEGGFAVTIFTFSNRYGFGWRRYKITNNSVHETKYEQLTWPIASIRY